MNFIKTIQASLFILICITSSYTAQAQKLLKPKFGLRAGASFATMFGPEEAGVEEEHKITVRVAVAATIKLPFHERFGLIAEVAYVQKGSYYTATADNSFLKMPGFGSEQPYIYGYTKNADNYTKKVDKNYKRRMGMNIINGYLEIPIMFYFEAVDDRLQFDLGASFGFLVSSEALGTIKFGDADILNSDNPDLSQFIEMDLDFKTLEDGIGATYDGTAKSAKIDGTTRYYPRGPSSYYLTDLTDKGGENLYSVFDIGLQVGVSYYFTPGLRVGLRGGYSFNDITTNKYDYSTKDLNSDGSYIVRDDHDANFSLQFFVGLQF